MSWFDEAASELDELRRRADSINGGSEKAFNVLWGAIVQEVYDLQNTKSFQIEPNGTTFERTLTHQAMPSRLDGTSRTLRTMRINLSKDKTRITCKAPSLGNYGTSNVEFQLEIHGGILQLMHEGNPIEIRAAARMLLRSFLFPELPLRSPQHVI